MSGHDIIALHGEFDVSAKATVDAELTRLLHAGGGDALIIDLRGLQFIDSSGVHSLVVAYREGARTGRDLILVRGGPAVMRVLELCGLDTRVMIADSIEHALTTGPEPPPSGGTIRAVA